jgi:hypothetical protein
MTRLEANDGQSDEAVCAAIVAADDQLIDDALGLPVSAGKQGRLWAALANRSALRGGVPTALTHWAVRHGILASECASDAETVLQEALLNAVVHGNFGLPGLSDFNGDLTAMERQVATLIDDPLKGPLPVVIVWSKLPYGCVVHIEDLGAGYTPIPADAAPPFALSGRGLRLIRAFSRRVRISRGGRRMSASFQHG